MPVVPHLTQRVKHYTVHGPTPLVPIIRVTVGKGKPLSNLHYNTRSYTHHQVNLTRVFDRVELRNWGRGMRDGSGRCHHYSDSAGSHRTESSQRCLLCNDRCQWCNHSSRACRTSIKGGGGPGEPQHTVPLSSMERAGATRHQPIPRK